MKIQKIFLSIFIFFGLLFAQSQFDDFLGIGETPTPPVRQQNGNFSPVDGLDLSDQIRKKEGTPFLRSSKEPPQPFITSDRLSIMSASGGALTLWGLKAGNWVWGYTPFDSISFGDARIWRIITQNDGGVIFKNEKTGTCLAAYGSGVIHNFCNTFDNTQKWKLLFFKNQSVQIQNKFYPDRCIDTSDSSSAFRIYLKTCIKQGEENLSQQWYIIPPLERTTPVFVTD